MGYFSLEAEEPKSQHLQSSYLNDKIHNHDNDDHENGSIDSNDDSDSDLHEQLVVENPRVAIACDDGRVWFYTIPDTDELIYFKMLPRVCGCAISVAWSADAKRIYSGSTDGFIRCWDAKIGREVCEISVGFGGPGSCPECCTYHKTWNSCRC